MLASYRTAQCYRLLLLGGILALTHTQSLNAQSSQGESHSKAEDQEIAEIYITAYRLCADAEKLAAKQNWSAAVRKARKAERVMAGIVRDHPTWRPNLVEMRRKIIAKNLALSLEKVKSRNIAATREPQQPNPRPFDPEQPRGRGRITHREQPLNVTITNNPTVTPATIDNSRQLYNELMRTREELRRLAGAYKSLSSEKNAAAVQLKIAEHHRRTAREELAALQKNISEEREAGNRVVASLNEQLSDLEARYRSSELARKDAEKRSEKIATELSQLQSEHALVVQERDSLREENTRLKEIVELNNPDKVKSLLDQNITLSSQLQEAQARVAELEAQVSSQGDEQSILRRQLDAARQEAEQLREEMGSIYDENLGYRRRISELSERTLSLEQELAAQAIKPTLDPAMQEENQLLRSIVAKQKRSISAQEQARRLLIETYKQIKGQDPALLGSLKKLEDESSLELSSIEHALIEAVQGSDEAEREGSEAIRESLEMEALSKGAEKAFAAQRYTAAEQLYRTIVEANPDQIAGLINLGTILLYRNKSEQAIEMFDRASRLASELPISFYMSGIANYRLDRTAEAAAKFARTLELDPANADAFFYLANIEGLLGQNQLALKHLAAALKLRPELADAHYNMARIYIEIGQLADAARAYDRAVHGGAQPDPELEAFLSNKLQRDMKPSNDLIASISPEDEAQLLGEMLKNDGTSPAEDSVSSSAAPSSEVQSAEAASYNKLSEGIVKDIKAAKIASPAGKNHRTAKKYFGRKRIWHDGKRHQLRSKKAMQTRLRLRGGPLPGSKLEEKN